MTGRPTFEFHWGAVTGPGLTTDFPKFPDADVKIIISGTRQYELHSSVLKNASPRMMHDLLQDKFAAVLSSKAIKKNITLRFRLQLIENPCVDDGSDKVKYILEPVLLNEEGKSEFNNLVSLDLENGKAVDPTFLAYHAVLGAFYQVPIDLGDFTTDALTDILTTAMEITKVAEYLDCTNVVAKPIEATLLSTGQTLFVSISNMPLAWLDFACRIRSRVLFREALVHACGQYFTDKVQTNLDTLDPAVASLLKKKATMLKDAVKHQFKLLLTYYPTHIQRQRTVGRADKDGFGRQSYQNDIFDWQSLVVLRHFFAHQVADDQTHQAQDLGKSVIDVIMKGGDAYLDKVALEDWHKLFPMSVKADNVVESKLADLKEFIKKYFQVFTKNYSQLDLNATPINHFTCVNVEATDYPWEAYTMVQESYEGGSDTEEDTEPDDDA